MININAVKDFGIKKEISLREISFKKLNKMIYLITLIFLDVIPSAVSICK